MRREYPYLQSPYIEDLNSAQKKTNFLSTIDNFVNQKQYVRITLLNWNESPIKEIQGELTSGNITKDGSSSIRTTCSLSCSVNGTEYSIEDSNMDFAINKKVFIEVGIKNYSKEYLDYPILWFPQGVFFIGSFNISSGATSSVNISLSLKDKMAGLNGDVGGVFPATTILDEMDTQSPTGAYISEKVLIYNIIQEVVNHWGGEDLNNIVIEDVPLRIKRVMKWSGDEPIWLTPQPNTSAAAGDLWYDVTTEPPDNTLEAELKRVLALLDGQQDAESEKIKAELQKQEQELEQLKTRKQEATVKNTEYQKEINKFQAKIDEAKKHQNTFAENIKIISDMANNNKNISSSDLQESIKIIESLKAQIQDMYNTQENNAEIQKAKECIQMLAEDEDSILAEYNQLIGIFNETKNPTPELLAQIKKYEEELKTVQNAKQLYQKKITDYEHNKQSTLDNISNESIEKINKQLDSIQSTSDNSVQKDILGSLDFEIKKINDQLEFLDNGIKEQTETVKSWKQTLDDTIEQQKKIRQETIAKTTQDYYARVDSEQIWANNPMPLKIVNGCDAGYIYDDFYYTGELVMQPGAKVTDALDQIKQYLGNYEYFYDEFGVFHFREIKNYMNTTQGKIVLEDMSKNDYLVEVTTSKSSYSFSDDSNLINITVNPQYENIKNDYIVQGKREMTSSDISYPVRYHLAIDQKPVMGNTYYDLLLYKEKDTGLTKAIFPLNVSELPNDNPNFNLIYRVISDNSFVYWDSDVWKEVECLSYYPKDIIGEVPDFFKLGGYTPKDWRTELFLQGLLNKNNGTSASMAYQEIKDTYSGASNQTWLGELWRNTRNQQLDVDFYYEELDAFWPTIYDLDKQKFYAETQDQTVYTAALTDGNYYLDFIEPNESQLGQFCVQNIGRRTLVTVNDDVNCLFQPEIPDIVFINLGDDAETVSEKRNECQALGQPYTQVPEEIFYSFRTGGYKNGAFDEIKYQLYTHTNYQKTLSLVTLPVFYLQPNTRVTINDKTTNTYGDYMAQSISLPLGPSGNMSVTCSECFERF